jgi:hypothetical protein
MEEKKPTDWNKLIAFCTVGLLICAAIPTIFVVYDRIRPPGSPPISSEVIVMTGWHLTIVIAAMLLGVGLNLVATIISSRTKTDSKQNDSPKIDDSPPVDSHEGCERTIKNLTQRVNSLTSNNETQGIQISARDGQIKQLEEQIEERQWLVDIADEQAQTIHRFVAITDWRTGRHELLRDDAYVEFPVTIWNRSVFNIYVSDVTGRLSFRGREFRGALSWNEGSRVITWSNTGQLTLRQALTRDDAVHILNHRSRFNFDQLRIEAQGRGVSRPVVIPKALNADQPSPSNEQLLVENPKLKIKTEVLTASFIVNFKEYSTSDDAYLSMAVKVKNHRDVPVVIESCELKVATSNGLQIAVAAEYGEIWKKMHIDKQGHLQRQDQKLDNLVNKLPLRLQHAEMSGDLQFVFKGARQIFLHQNVDYELILTDHTGERHPVNGIINEVES